jgi:hypothetical protein
MRDEGVWQLAGEFVREAHRLRHNEGSGGSSGAAARGHMPVMALPACGVRLERTYRQWPSTIT